MIGALGEGVSQSLLPCSWAVLFPSIAMGMSTSRWRTLAGFWVSLWISSWVVVAGALGSPPIWLAGLILIVGALLYWLVPARAVNAPAAALVGMGTAWAWRPCVGPALGGVLNTALSNPLAAVPGLAAFLLGLAGAGIVLGRLAARLSRHDWRRPAAIGVVAIGSTMLVGIYPVISSTLAHWSVALWA